MAKQKLVEFFNDDFTEEDMLDENGNILPFDEANEMIADILADRRMELDVATDGEIILIGHIQRWNGVHDAYKLVGSRLSNILYPREDMSTNRWYDNGKDIIHEECHHDGTNSYTYRVLKGNSHDEQVANAEKLYSKPLTPRRIGYYTKSIRPIVAEIYGWK